MATITIITLSLKPKWWMRPAVVAGAFAIWLGLIKAKPDAAYFDGIISPEDRVAKWLADYAFLIEVA